MTEVLLNYRKDGTPFWNELSVSPVFDAAGKLVHFVGVQADVTARIDAEEQRTAALDAARDAQRRLGLLARTSHVLGEHLEVKPALDALAGCVVPTLGDWCVITLASDRDRRPIVARHSDPARTPEVLRLQELHQPSNLTDASPTQRVLAGEPYVLVEQVLPGSVSGYVADDEFARLIERLGIAATLVVPLVARSQVIGTLALVQGSADRRFSTEDVRTALDVGRRAGLAVDNIRLYSAEHAAAETLQRSLLPVLSEVPGLELCAHYLPSSSAGAVGGDWYDVLELPDGATGVAIGDVMGHDLSAAAAMGQLRSVLRSYAWEGDRPAQVLDRLNRLVQGLDMAQLATCVYARLTRVDGGGELVWSNAGHLSPLVRLPDGVGHHARRRPRRGARRRRDPPGGGTRVPAHRERAGAVHRRPRGGPAPRARRRARRAGADPVRLGPGHRRLGAVRSGGGVGEQRDRARRRRLPAGDQAAGVLSPAPPPFEPATPLRARHR